MLDDHKKRVIIVDDDAEIRDLLATYLGKQGFDVVCFADGSEVENHLVTTGAEALILDVMMPHEDGFSVCQRLRRVSSIPIIMLTASAEETDRIVGLELGADDYVAKPFNPRELLARIKAVLRRVEPSNDNRRVSLDTLATIESERYVSFAGWKLDTVNRDLIDHAGTAIALSGADYNLLHFFLEKPNTILSRDDLSLKLHGREATPYDRSIDVQISRLRQRLGDDAKEPHIIKTVRAKGYVLSVEVGLAS